MALFEPAPLWRVSPAPSAWTVSQLTARVRALVEDAPDLRDFWVVGEISNFRHHTSGHMYFTLKDEGATLRCVIFRARAERLAFRPANGMRVQLRGQLRVYAADGSYQCYGAEMRPDGLGSLHVAFEQLKARLAALGLFDTERKRGLPRLPRRVLVVTSPDAAALRDVVQIARGRCAAVELVLVPTAVQGAEAPAAIVRALGACGRVAADVVLLVRGGGSLEELWAFNDEGVARAIRDCPLPVVTGIGHETDFTIADFAADRRAPTPSGAAELVVPDQRALRAEVAAAGIRAEQAVRARLRQARQRLDGLARGPLARPEAAFLAQRTRWAHLQVRLATSGQVRVAQGRATWRHATGRLAALSPLAVLSRGYAVCRLGDGTVVRRPTQAATGDRIEILVQEGRLWASVQEHGPAWVP